MFLRKSDADRLHVAERNGLHDRACTGRYCVHLQLYRCHSSTCRNFLRLGNPLNCSLNDITVEDLNRTFADGAHSKSADNGEATNENGRCGAANKIAPYGGSLSLASIQSLVSMTTPRDRFQMGMIGNPPFVEFDLSVDGFGYLFLPSVFPQSIEQTVTAGGQTTTVTITPGIGGGGERPFPPGSGLSFSSWVLISK